MTKKTEQPKAKIVSAVSLFRTYDTTAPLDAVLLQERTYLTGMSVSQVTYGGHAVADGQVRIYAKYARPAQGGKLPAILLLPDAGKELDEELMYYFVQQGYAVLMPDYSGAPVQETQEESPVKESVSGEQLAMKLDLKGALETTSETLADALEEKKEQAPCAYTVPVPNAG